MSENAERALEKQLKLLSERSQREDISVYELVALTRAMLDLTQANSTLIDPVEGFAVSLPATS